MQWGGDGRVSAWCSRGRIWGDGIGAMGVYEGLLPR
jgi:hypothetical protein